MSRYARFSLFKPIPHVLLVPHVHTCYIGNTRQNILYNYFGQIAMRILIHAQSKKIRSYTPAGLAQGLIVSPSIYERDIAPVYMRLSDDLAINANTTKQFQINSKPIYPKLLQNRFEISLKPI